MRILGYTTTIVIFMLINTIWSGYALSILWGWFIVPVFSIQEISIPTAIGVVLVVGFLTHQDPTKLKDNREFSEVLLEGIIKGLTRPAIALATGLVITLFL